MPLLLPSHLWLQGGGGASPPWGRQTGPFALDGFAGGGPSTFGMLCEKIGPFTTPDNATGEWVLRDNPETWDSMVKVRSWRGHSCPPEAPLTAFEGLGLPSALVRRGPASQVAPIGHDLPARVRPS